MKRVRKLWLVLLTVLTSVLLLGGSVLAVTSGEAYNNLKKAVANGEVRQVSGEPNGPYARYANGFSTKQYRTSGGGYYIYSEIVAGIDDSGNIDIINDMRFSELTASAKQELLKDVLTCANALVYAEKSTKGAGDGVTDDTVTTLMSELQTKSGMGSQLMATLLANTKPDYITANRIYAPFSGPIGVALGLISIFMMGLLGVTMALDIAYIVIPAFQILLDGDTDNGGQGGTKGMSKIISAAARNAVKAADGGGNGQTGSGNKMALGVYFKYRWKELIVLGICLLYLVQGQIYSFVAWILDLVSGFLGF